MCPRIGISYFRDSRLGFRASLCRKHRGLSTVVTSAMMLSAVAVLGTALVSLSNSNFKTFEMSFTNSISAYSNQINEDLNIEDVWFGSNPTKFVNVTMTNVGTVSLNVTDIKMIDTTGTHDHLFNQVILPKAQNSTVISYNWQSSVPVQIVVTTARGATFQTQAMHP